LSTECGQENGGVVSSSASDDYFCVL